MFEIQFSDTCFCNGDNTDLMNAVVEQIQQKLLSAEGLSSGPIEFQLPNGDCIQADIVPTVDKATRRKRTLRDYAKEAVKMKAIGDSVQQPEEKGTSSAASNKSKAKKRSGKSIKRKSKKPVRIWLWRHNKAHQ